MSDVTVRSIDALEKLQTGLIRYADQTQATLDAVQRTLDWLDERVRHWQNEVLRSQGAVQQAIAAYQRCMASGERDHPPSCGHLEAAVYEARRRLAHGGGGAHGGGELSPRDGAAAHVRAERHAQSCGNAAYQSERGCAATPLGASALGMSLLVRWRLESDSPWAQ